MLRCVAMSEPTLPTFAELNLSDALLHVLSDIGYETPSPIQAATIPLLLANRDVLGSLSGGSSHNVRESSCPQQASLQSLVISRMS